MNKKYFWVPQWNSVFEVKEDCCFKQIIYSGFDKGVLYRKDEEDDWLHSYDLLCYDCNPAVKIIPIEKSFYDHAYQLALAA